jgi:hypothetical protein
MMFVIKKKIMIFQNRNETKVVFSNQTFFEFTFNATQLGKPVK